MQPWPARADSKAPARDGWRNKEGWEPPTDLSYNGTYGLLMGERSGNMEMLEIEGRAVNDGTAENFFDRLNAAGLGDIWAEIEQFQVFSPSGGAHYYYRVSDGRAAPNTKLAFDENPERPETLIETRGEGGFVVGPGSVTSDGRKWQLANGAHPENVAVITAEQRDAIFEVARSLDRRIRRSPETPVDSILRAGNSGDDLRDWIVEKIGVAELLEGMGWEIEGGNGHGGLLLTRPGKDEGTSGELKDDGMFLVYSTTAQAAWKGELREGPTHAWAIPMGVLAEARFDGHLDKAMSWVRKQINNDNAATPAQPDGSDSSTYDPVAQWAGMDLRDLVGRMRAGTYERKTPTVGHLHGTDHGLIYPGLVNVIFGKSGVGKTWISYASWVDEVRKGNSVLIVDYEQGPEITMERLVLDFGLTDEELERVTYVYPDTGVMTAVEFGYVAGQEYDLVLIDSAGEAMSRDGDFSSNDADDVTKWIAKGCKDLGVALGDATILIIDHAGKDESKGMAGSFRKLAAVSGIAWHCKANGNPFDQKTKGSFSMKVEKDRVGTLGGASVTVHVDPTGEHITVEATKNAADVDSVLGKGVRPKPKAELLERIEAALGGFPVAGETTWVMQSDVIDATTGKKSEKTNAIHWMMENDLLEVETREHPTRPGGQKVNYIRLAQPDEQSENFFD